MKKYHRSVFSYPTFKKACSVAREVSKHSSSYMYVFEEEDGFYFDTRYDPNSEGVSDGNSPIISGVPQ